jgi:hypothetical protein
MMHSLNQEALNTFLAELKQMANDHFVEGDPACMSFCLARLTTAARLAAETRGKNEANQRRALDSFMGLFEDILKGVTVE